MHRSSWRKYEPLYERMKAAPMTTLEIARFLRTCAPSTEVSALRSHLVERGENVTCEQVGKTDDGKKIMLYSIRSEKVAGVEA